MLTTEQWDTTTQGVAQAYFGTVVPHFPNFFILMGPVRYSPLLAFQTHTNAIHQNTVTGHLSVIYTVECQINFTLRLLTPILQSLPSYQSHTFTPSLFLPAPTTIEVRPEAAIADSKWTQSEAKKLVWASGCTNWAVDAKTGMNNMMYPDWQFSYWLRSIFWKKADFVYRDEKSGAEVSPGKGVRWLRRLVLAAVLGGALFKRDRIMQEVFKGVRELKARGLVLS